MSLFGNRTLFRRWARALALAWLFALGAGMAHACVTEASHAHRASGHVRQAGQEHASQAGECPAACGDVSLSPPARGQDDAGIAPAGPPTFPAPRHRVEAALAPRAERLAPSVSIWRPLPVPIAFLRLAL